VKLGQTSLILSLLSFLLAARPAFAQANVTPTPPNLTVVGTRCLLFDVGCDRVERNLLLRTDQTITNLQAIALDLERADGARVFPASAIQIALPDRPLQSGQPLNLSIRFNFSQTQSGEYSGVLLLVYPDGELVIPAIARIKDHWFWPLLVLMLGIILGMGLSAYRAEGMARDEIVVQVSRLRTQMRSDPEFAAVFRIQIEGYLIDGETALENKRWETAQEALVQAESFWNKWRKSREDWIAQLSYCNSLRDRLEQIPNANAFYIQAVRSRLEDTARESATLEKPQLLRQSLQELQQQINRYLQSQNQLEDLKQLAAREPEQPLQFKVESLQQVLDNLTPTDSEAFENWKQAVAAFQEELSQTFAQQEVTEATPGRTPLGLRNLFEKKTLELLAPVPSVLPPPDFSAAKAAQSRLYWFNWLSRIIAVGLLAGAGFVELYAGNPTFGTTSWSDYFSLMAWGFGAEVTRESITKVVRDLRVPGFGQS
jgi:hypothetical protein